MLCDFYWFVTKLIPSGCVTVFTYLQYSYSYQTLGQAVEPMVSLQCSAFFQLPTCGILTVRKRCGPAVGFAMNWTELELVPIFPAARCEGFEFVLVLTAIDRSWFQSASTTGGRLPTTHLIVTEHLVKSSRLQAGMTSRCSVYRHVVDPMYTFLYQTDGRRWSQVVSWMLLPLPSSRIISIFYWVLKWMIRRMYGVRDERVLFVFEEGFHGHKAESISFTKKTFLLILLSTWACWHPCCLSFNFTSKSSACSRHFLILL